MVFQVVLDQFVGGEEGAGGGDRGDDDAADALVEAAEQEARVDGAGGGGSVEARIVGGLDAGFQRVEGVDEEVDGEGCEGAGLDGMPLIRCAQCL